MATLDDVLDLAEKCGEWKMPLKTLQDAPGAKYHAWVDKMREEVSKWPPEWVLAFERKVEKGMEEHPEEIATYDALNECRKGMQG